MTTVVVSPAKSRVRPAPRSLRSVLVVIVSVLMLRVAVPPRREPRASASTAVVVIVPTRVMVSAVANFVASSTAPSLVVTWRVCTLTLVRSWLV